MSGVEGRHRRVRAADLSAICPDCTGGRHCDDTRPWGPCGCAEMQHEDAPLAMVVRLLHIHLKGARA